MNIILFEALSAQNELSMQDPRAQHICKILRLKEGESFQAGIINVGKGTATLTDLEKEHICFDFVLEDTQSAHLYPVTLLVSQVRPICMRRILREAVSLGVQTIILCTTQTGEKSYAQATLYTSGEYRSILLDGAMQSGKCGVSEVQFAPSVASAMKLLDETSQRIVLDNVREGSSLAHATITAASVVLAIGGERGFTDEERSVFESNGFSFAALGSRILRTETACSAGLAVLLGRMGLL